MKRQDVRIMLSKDQDVKPNFMRLSEEFELDEVYLCYQSYSTPQGTQYQIIEWTSHFLLLMDFLQTYMMRYNPKNVNVYTIIAVPKIEYLKLVDDGLMDDYFDDFED